ncbi:putative leader peptide [Streptomyces eurocidicus]|uniref:putative leader peptide n=1 Tax=Streptomyces eurocidicus TaxID=66423 RepID=UPI0035DD1EB4
MTTGTTGTTAASATTTAVTATDDRLAPDPRNFPLPRVHGPRGGGIPVFPGAKRGWARHSLHPGRRSGHPAGTQWLPTGTPVPRRVVYDDVVTMLVKRRHVDLLRVTSMSCRRFG